MLKFTPGPWINEETAVAGPDGTLTVALLNTGNKDFKANARLIAAAPDLYELLQEVLDGDQSEIWSSQLQLRIEETLAKARGEHE